MEGWFPKMEQDGWTGLAFVNVSSAAAAVILTAYDEYGARIEQRVLTVPAQNKVVAMTFQFFLAELTNARYFTFTSDQKVVAFTVSGSTDGTKLDGLATLDRYVH